MSTAVNPNNRKRPPSIDALTAEIETAKLNLRDAKNPGDLVGEETSLIRLKVADVRPYGDNPRQQVNPNFESIKSSIRERGLDAMLTVVKCPGDDYYTLAKGGKTRLLSLQDLATEPGGDKFIEQDFLIKRFTNTSELLAAHLVENMQRADMSFWDTARGIVLMRDTLAKEVGKPISQPEFAQLLKAKGVVVDEKLPPDCMFALTEFSGLGQFAHELARDHIRRSLRPAFMSLSALWTKHDGRKADQFIEMHRKWVSEYAVAEKEYSLEKLQAFIHSGAAYALGYTTEQLTALLALSAREEHKKATLSELLELIALKSQSESGDGAQRPDMELDGHAQQLSPELALLSARLSTKGGLQSLKAGDQLPDPSLAGSGDGSSGQDQDDDGGDAPMGFAGVPGLQVASGLTPRAPKDPASASARGSAGQGGTDQSTLPGVAGVDADTPQLSLEQASWQAAIVLADTAGIRSLIKPCEQLPCKFFVDLPQPGLLGTSSTDIAVEAWWLLAAISGQIVQQLAEIMPECEFKTGFLNVEAWPEILGENLGGDMLIDSAWLVDILINTSHELSQPLQELLAALRAMDSASKQSTGGDHE